MCIRTALIQIVNGPDHHLQRGAFTAQFLGPFRLLPNAGFRELELYFGETIFLFSVVKDTP